MTATHIEFNVHVGRQKPESIINASAKCPFCDRDKLTNIIDADGDLLLIKNKYPVLKNTFQTVLIETTECHSELSMYSKEHLYKLFRFGIKNWFKLIESNKFKSVIFFKNHGKLSGGTIRHPHMQIIGLEEIDYHTLIFEEHFTGVLIDKNNGVELNISTKPRVGFSEFNIITDDNNKIEQIADYAQNVSDFILNNFGKRCDSYNMFFYLINDLIHVKIMPRFPTSPLYIGYSIPQVSNHVEELISTFRSLYL